MLCYQKIYYIGLLDEHLTMLYDDLFLSRLMIVDKFNFFILLHNRMLRLQNIY